MANRPPDNFAFCLSEDVTGACERSGVLHLEGDMMQPRAIGLDKIEGMVLDTRSHENEMFADTVSYLKTENTPVKFTGSCDIGHTTGNVADPQRRDAVAWARRMNPPIRYEFDFKAIQINEDHAARNAGMRIVPDFGGNSVVSQLSANFLPTLVDMREKRQAGQCSCLASAKQQCIGTGTGGKIGVIAAAFDKAKPD
ncbi:MULTISPECIES: hypothetical protein [unclassified Rhizobium]|uniref:hypothetical protein n=1 Tax=Rhizobium sp. WW_1 TaxID=1907375 RepID=UPI001FDFBFCD|nr:MULTISPECIES: hypothetical protein [unclassified Rhizobium]